MSMHMHTPVDNLVFVEKLQPQHHAGRIEAAERGWCEGARPPHKEDHTNLDATSSKAPHSTRLQELGGGGRSEKGLRHGVQGARLT